MQRNPVRIDEVYDVNIESTGSRGDGVAKVNGFIIFVPGTNVGDQLKVKITKVMPKFAFAEVVRG